VKNAIATVLLAALAAACTAATEDEASNAAAALDVPGTLRIRTEVEVLSGARSEACATGLSAPGCAILTSPTQRTFSRYAGPDASQERLTRATTYVCERFAAAAGVRCDDGRTTGTRVALQRFSSNDHQQANIVTTIPGTDASARPIIVGAHHDSTTNEGAAPGAMDNASGVAVLLEVVRAFRDVTPRATVIVVAFAAEEGPSHAVGSDGSRHYVASLGCTPNGTDASACASRFAAMLNLDMLARPRMRRVGNTLQRFTDVRAGADEVRLFARSGTDACASAAAGDSVHQALGRTLAVAARVSASSERLEVRAQTTADRMTNGFARFSDHFSFHEVGIPAVRLIGPSSVDDAALNHTSFDRTSHNGGAYAMSERDEDQVLDWDYLSRAASLVTVLVRSLAIGLPAPTPVFDDAAPGAPRLRWAAVPGASRYIIALRSAARTPGENGVARMLEARGDATAMVVDPGFRTAAIAAVGPGGLVGPLSREVVLQRACADLAPPVCASPFTIDCHAD
jgi:hypothetical protein